MGDNAYDVFVGKFTPKGQQGWSKSLMGDSTQTGAAIAGSATGTVTVTGDFYTEIDFGAGVVTSNGEADGFVVVFGP